MLKRALVLTTTMAILACSTIAASAQTPGSPGPASQQSPTTQEHDQVIQGGMMGPGMMGPGYGPGYGWGPGMMGPRYGYAPGEAEPQPKLSPEEREARAKAFAEEYIRRYLPGYTLEKKPPTKKK